MSANASMRQVIQLNRQHSDGLAVVCSQQGATEAKGAMWIVHDLRVHGSALTCSEAPRTPCYLQQPCQMVLQFPGRHPVAC